MAYPRIFLRYILFVVLTEQVRLVTLELPQSHGIYKDESELMHANAMCLRCSQKVWVFLLVSKSKWRHWTLSMHNLSIKDLWF